MLTNLTDVMNGILPVVGLPPVERRISPRVAYAVAVLLEAAYKLLRIQSEPLVTRFMVSQVSTAHWFDISAARRDLGYEPAISRSRRVCGAWPSPSHTSGLVTRRDRRATAESRRFQDVATRRLALVAFAARPSLTGAGFQHLPTGRT